MNIFSQKPITIGFFLTIVSLLMTSSFQLYAKDYAKTKKELMIMTRIFETSLSETSQQRNNFLYSSSKPSVESTYLAKQGMVFSFSFNHPHYVGGFALQHFSSDIGNLISDEIHKSLSSLSTPMPSMPVAPTAPVVAGDWEEENIAAYEQQQEAVEMLRDAQRKKRAQIRELQRAMRELERLARHDKEADKTLPKKKQKLENKIAKLSKKMQEYQKKVNEFRLKKKAEIEKRNKAKADLILSTLCDYGSTLKSLNKNEYITLIFENFKSEKDLIQIFSFQDVKSCSNKDALVKKSIAYSL